ncbi:malto-oligosyltrehalose synthase [Uliginosibacterium sp. H1]|uniref:malto-oligosyltrehalose synthase n=1 Tax=Uliginosibacterium sp. H1 TaxID=3114757 RepID=UPI002E180FCB|nr:malto-oligosyltrehalose synthase [Uliginosibacterium sp. H1]
MSEDALDRLCEYIGIATSYTDAFGEHIRASAATKRSLAIAMGFAAQDETAAHDTLLRLQQEDAARMLPPVMVVREGQGVEVQLRPGPELGNVLLAWRLICEDGQEFRGILSAMPAGAAQVTIPLQLSSQLPLGYHDLTVSEATGAMRVLGRMRLVICPHACHTPAQLAAGGRVWGPVVQVYALRSSDNWGVGDYSDLRRLMEVTAAQGAQFMGLSPTHALFPHEAERASPYSPSSRTWLNVLYLGIEAIADFAEHAALRARVATPEFQERLAALRATELVDYAAVGALKFEALEALYAHFRQQHLLRGTRRGRQFREFQREGGASLRLHALFEALQAHFFAQDPHVWGWTTWPEAYRDSKAAAVRRFARDHEERVEFFEYLQWQADLQLRGLCQRAESLGMQLGLYRDLAVGVNQGGSETWMQPALFALKASVGAPPEEFNLTGQDWGLPPQVPRRLRDAAYEPFVEVLRANMRNAGALRLDHVMGLMRLYWVPAGSSATEGTYVAYPLHDLLGIVALESVRQQCLIIGEDLGTVADEMRHAMASQAMLSYKPFYFERGWEGRFKPPAEWTPHALVAVSTHDLPTLRSFWNGFDLELRTKLELFPTESLRERQIQGRADDRWRLLEALTREGLLPEGLSPDPRETPEATTGLVRAIHQYLARTPSRLMGVQLEDVFGQLEQVNVPSTSEDRYPNWRRKLPLSLDDARADGRLAALSRAIESERPLLPRDAPTAEPVPPLDSAIIPRATYRLQFHKDFRFQDATAIVPYLARLGVSHVYASPYLQSRPGSTHGYDIVNHDTINPEIGSEEDFDAFCDVLREHGMQQVLDFVPNHMGVMGADNAWWQDVLEHGEASESAQTFDIDWSPPDPDMQGRLLVPVLGDHYGVVLESGELRPVFDLERGEFRIEYHGNQFPVDPREYPRVLEALQSQQVFEGEHASNLEAFRALLADFAALPPRDATQVVKRREAADACKQRLSALCKASDWVHQLVRQCAQSLAGRVGDPHSFDALDSLIRVQAWRLAHWRAAADDINYRRFFDINNLAALRMESESVFEATHATVLRWLEEGRVAGLRLDHPDGLFDPQGYYRRLQERYTERRHAAQPDEPRRALYVLVEKILADYERLPAQWDVHGSTGYDFTNLVNGLFVDTDNESRFDRIYAAFSGEKLDYDEVLYRSKLLIMMNALASELNMLTHRLHRIAKADRRTCDFTHNRLRRTLMQVTACFPVYRTYIGEAGVRSEDRRYLAWAIAAARRRSPSEDDSVLDFVHDILLGAGGDPHPAGREAILRFIGAFQQFTSPVTAKGMEDTAFYRYNRLVSLNEVGGDPRNFGISVNAFHAANQHRARFAPYTMLATSTHDTKRGEDVRARIDVLSETPGHWRLALRRWSHSNDRLRARTDGELAPSRNDEYLLYQTLLGSWPSGEGGRNTLDQAALDAYRERIHAYMLKATREAKARTSWARPDEEYERALAHFIDGLLGSPERNAFLADFLPLQQRVAEFGYYNSLAMTLLKLTVPGVPDIYQGCEHWNFSLVDPDNRRPVDHDALQTQLGALQGSHAGAGTLAAGLMDSVEDGRVKLHMVAEVLGLRRRLPQLFERGRYLSVGVQGPAAAHLVAFARYLPDRNGERNGEQLVVVLVPRLLHTLAGGDITALRDAGLWAGSFAVMPETLDTQRFRELFSQRELSFDARLRLPLDSVFAAPHSVFPFAVLVADHLADTEQPQQQERDARP